MAHSGAMIALVVPDPENYALRSPDENAVPANELHITLGYLGEAADISDEQRAAILDACQVLADTSNAPEALFPASTGVFPPDPESTEQPPVAPYYAAPSNSEVFNSLREDLLIHLAARGVAELVSTKHPVFNPHVTLTYAPLTEAPDLSYLPTPLPTTFSQLICRFADEEHVFSLGVPADGPPLPLTASVRHTLHTLSETQRVSEDYLTALYLRQRQVRSTPAQSRAQAALNRVHELVDPDHRVHTFTRIHELADRTKIEPDPAARIMLANRALSLASRTAAPHTPNEARELAALTASLRAIIADGNSSIARSLRARRQLRDRYGRWIEEGGGVRFKIRKPGTPGGGTWYHGTVAGFDIPNSKVFVKLEDGKTYAIPNNKLEQPKAILGLKAPTTTKLFKPRSADRKGKATLPGDFNPEKAAASDATDEAAVKALENIYEDSKGQASTDPTGGHLVRLALDASNTPEYADAAALGEKTFDVTGKIAPFKGENISLNTEDITAVRKAYDAKVAEIMPPESTGDSAEDKKNLQKAQSAAIGNLAGLFNDRHDAETKDLRKAPSVGTEEDLKKAEVSPDAANPNKLVPETTQEELVAAANDAFDQLAAAVPDDSPLAKHRDRIESALAAAIGRYEKGDDTHDTFLKNLDAIKEYANAQEPSFKPSYAAKNPAEEAFGAFAEDIDNIHAHAGGQDEIAAAKSALADVQSAVETALADPEQTQSGGLEEIDQLAYQINSGIESGQYLNKTDQLAKDLHDLSQQIDDNANSFPDGEHVDAVRTELNDSAEKIGGAAPAAAPTAPAAPETPSAAEPAGIDDPANYTDAPAGATPDQQAQWDSFQQAAGDLMDVWNDGSGNWVEPNDVQNVPAIHNAADAVTQQFDAFENGDPVDPQKLIDAAAEFAKVSKQDGGFDAKKIENFEKSVKDFADKLPKSDNSAAPVEQTATSPDLSKFEDIYNQFKEIHDEIPNDQQAEKFQVAAIGNIVANTGKEIQQGKVTPEEGAQTLKRALDAFESMNKGTALDGTKVGDDIQGVVDQAREVQNDLANGKFDTGAPAPKKEATLPETPAAETTPASELPPFSPFRPVLTGPIANGPDAPKSWAELQDFLKGKDIISFDFESTGLDVNSSDPQDAPIEVGAVRIRDGKVIDKFQTLINPGKPISDEASKITGIKNEDVVGAPDMGEAYGQLMEWAGSDPNSVWAAHNATFDMAVLQSMSDAAGETLPELNVLDTLSLARAGVPREDKPNVGKPGLQNHKLSSLADAFGIKYKDAHRADVDAELAGQLIPHIIDYALEHKLTDTPFTNLKANNEQFNAEYPNWVKALDEFKKGPNSDNIPDAPNPNEDTSPEVTGADKYSEFFDPNTFTEGDLIIEADKLLDDLAPSLDQNDESFKTAQYQIKQALTTAQNAQDENDTAYALIQAAEGLEALLTQTGPSNAADAEKANALTWALYSRADGLSPADAPDLAPSTKSGDLQDAVQEIPDPAIYKALPDPVAEKAKEFNDSLESSQGFTNSDLLEALINDGNIYLDELDTVATPNPKSDTAAVVEGEKARVEKVVQEAEKLADAADSGPVSPAEKLTPAKVQGVINNLKGVDNIAAKVTAEHLQNKLDNGEEITQKDLNDIADLFHIVADSNHSTDVETADANNTADALDTSGAVPEPSAPEGGVKDAAQKLDDAIDLEMQSLAQDIGDAAGHGADEATLESMQAYYDQLDELGGAVQEALKNGGSDEEIQKQILDAYDQVGFDPADFTGSDLGDAFQNLKDAGAGDSGTPPTPPAPPTPEPAEDPDKHAQSVADWTNALQGYLDAYGKDLADPSVTKVAGAPHHPLSESQVANIQKVIHALPAKDGEYLETKLGEHIDKKISDDDLIQAISTVAMNNPNKKLKGVLSGAQAGIQANKYTSVDIISPDADLYNSPDGTPLFASPDVVKGHIKAVLKQHTDGKDLASLSPDTSEDDSKVRDHIVAAQKAMQDALVAFNDGDVATLTAKLREALDNYDEARKLRDLVDKDDHLRRRLMARRRSVDEVLAAFENRFPDPINGGNEIKFDKPFDVNGHVFVLDKNGTKIYPGDRYIRHWKGNEGQEGIMLGSRNSLWNGQAYLKVKEDQKKNSNSQGVSAATVELTAVGPNNPLFHDPSYTGPKVDTTDELIKWNGQKTKKGAVKVGHVENPVSYDPATGTHTSAPKTEAPEKLKQDAIYDGYLNALNGNPTAAELESITDSVQQDSTEKLGVKNYNLLMKKIDDLYKVRTGKSITDYIDSKKAGTPSLAPGEKEPTPAEIDIPYQTLKEALDQGEIGPEDLHNYVEHGTPAAKIAAQKLLDEANAPTQPAKPEAGTNPTPELLDSLKPGEHIRVTSGNQDGKLVKKDDGNFSWQPDSGGKLTVTPEEAVDFFKITDSPEPTPEPEKLAGDLAGHPDAAEQLDAMPIGAQVVADIPDTPNWDGVWEKQPNGYWFNSKTGALLDSEDIANMPVNSLVPQEAKKSDLHNLYLGEINSATSQNEVVDLLKKAADDYHNGKLTTAEWTELLNNAQEKIKGFGEGPDNGPGGGGTPPTPSTPSAPEAPAATEPDTPKIKPDGSLFSILPKAERGKSGDGYFPGTSLWGKYGAAGIAITATDENGKKKVLIGKRGDSNLWYLPGGALEEKETPHQGAARELEEEVKGAEGITDSLEHVADHVFEHPSGWTYTTIVANSPTMFDAKAPDNAPPWEFSEFMWADAEELAKLEAEGALHEKLGNGELAAKAGLLPGSEPTPSDTEQLPADDNSSADLVPAPEDLFNPAYDITGWKMVQGSLGGANGGGVYEDSEGNRYYVKNVPSVPHAHNEVLASALYQALGVNTTHARIGTNSLGQTFVVTKFVEGAKTDLKKRLDKNDTEWIAKAQQNMAIDALLGNYDVVGPNYTNMVTGPDGEPLRLDHGGALAYRGTGSKKSWWSDTVSELDYLRSSSGAPAPSFGTASKLFGTMTDEDVRNSAKKLLTISPQQITDIVNASGLSDKEKEKMAARLIKRRHDILEKTNLLTPVSDGNTPENASKKLDDALSAAEEGAKVDAPSAPMFSIGDTVHYTGPNNEEIQLTGTIVGQSGPNFSIQSESGKKYLFHYSHIAPGEHPDNAQPVITNSKGTSFKNGDEAWFHDATSGEFLHGTIGEDHIFSPTGMGVLGVDFNTDAGDNWSAAPDDLYTASEHAAIQDLLGNLTPPAATSLGDGYAALPEGAVPMYTFDTPMAKYQKVLVQHPDRKFYMYKPDGSVAQAYKQSLDSYTKNPKWKKWDGEVVSTTPPTTTESSLPENYPTPPEGAKVLYEHFNEDKSFHAFLVQYPDGTLHAYYPKGSKFATNDIYDITDPTITIDHYKHDPDWTPVGDVAGVTPQATTDISDTGDDSAGPLSANNKPLKVGDKVHTTIKGKKVEGVVTGVLPDNRVKVSFTDEHGNKKTSLRQASKWFKQDAVQQQGDSSTADPSSPLYGAPKPEAPQSPEATAGPFVSDEWMAKAGEAYKERKAKLGKVVKDFTTSGYYSKYTNIQNNGSVSDLDFLLSHEYIDQNLYDEAKAQIDKVQAVVDGLQKEYEGKLNEYKKQIQDWYKANGIDPTSFAGAPKNATELFTGGDADWSKAGSLGTPSAEAVFEAMTASGPALAMRGSSFLADGDSIEDLDVRVTHVRDAEGKEVLEARFKLTAWAGDKLKQLFSQDPEVTSSPGATLYKRINSDDDIPTYTHDQKYSTSGTTYSWTDPQTGVTVEFMRTEDGKTSVSPNALHNNVRVRMPVGSTPEDFQNVMTKLGIEKAQPATPQDVETYVKNKLVTIFNGETDVTKNKTGDALEAALAQIESNHGVTIADVKMGTDARGRTKLFLSDEATQKMIQYTKVKGFKHNVYNSSSVDVWVALLSGPQAGLVATHMRWDEGIGGNGMSQDSDMTSGGGDYSFTKVLHTTPSTAGDGGTITLHPKAMLRRLDHHGNAGDGFGKHHSNTKSYDLMQGNPYEITWKHGIPTSDFWYVTVPSSIRAQVIQKLKERGIYTINGVPVEDFVLSSGMTVPTVDPTQWSTDALPPAAPSAPSAGAIQ